MALLQDPLKSLDQIEWYMQNQPTEKFPGAFLIAAGNLSRQSVEQMLFIICFYGGLPRSKYLRPDLRLKDLAAIIDALGKAPPTPGKTYWAAARRRGPRIAKFARLRRKFGKWRRLFNDPSHYSIPGHVRKIGLADVKDFVNEVKPVLDKKDSTLILAAYNELLSDGKIVAGLSNDAENSPAISLRVPVKISDLIWDGTGIKLAHGRLHVFSKYEEIRPRKLRGPALIAGLGAPPMRMQLVTEYGNPIDLTSMGTILKSFIRSKRDVTRLKRHLGKFGLKVEVDVAEKNGRR